MPALGGNGSHLRPRDGVITRRSVCPNDDSLRRCVRVGAGLPALVAVWALAWAGSSAAQEGRLGEFDGHEDIGAPRISGSATYNAVSQEYALAAAGTNMWARRDEFHFAWKRMKGDFILQARVEFVGQGVDPHRKLGLMVRTQSRRPTRRTPTSPCTATASPRSSSGAPRARTRRRSDRPSPGRTCPARAEGKHLHPLGRPLRRPLRDEPAPRPRPRRRGLRGTVPLLAQPRVSSRRRYSVTCGSSGP